MKQKELKEMKPGSKNTPAKKRNPGSGGARPGSGRDPLPYEAKRLPVDVPDFFIALMKEKNIKNRTGYVVNLLAKDLIEKGDLKKAQLKKVQKVKDSTDKFNPFG